MLPLGAWRAGVRVCPVGKGYEAEIHYWMHGSRCDRPLFLSCGVAPGSPGVATEVKLITLDPAHFVNWRDPLASHLLGNLLYEHQSERAIREWEAVQRSAAPCAGRYPAQNPPLSRMLVGMGISNLRDLSEIAAITFRDLIVSHRSYGRAPVP